MKKKLFFMLFLAALITGCSKEDDLPTIKDTTFSYELSMELKIHSYLNESYVDTAKVVAVYEFNDNDDIVESHIFPLESNIKHEFIANELSTKVRVLYEFNDSYSLDKYQEKKVYHRWIQKVYFLKKNDHLTIYDDISLYYSSTRP